MIVDALWPLEVVVKVVLELGCPAEVEGIGTGCDGVAWPDDSAVPEGDTECDTEDALSDELLVLGAVETSLTIGVLDVAGVTGASND